jgi:hypothetical protein
MIAPRYGDPCICEACTIAGVRGQRTVEIKPGIHLHGRDLARHYAQLRKFNERFDQGKPQEVPRG